MSTTKYNSKSSDLADLENLSERLKADLRRHIRNLAIFPVLSAGWLEVSDTVSRVAGIASTESTLPRLSADATIWETEEVALRFILEDGKLNLCLRALHEYKSYQRDAYAEVPPRVHTPEQVASMLKFEVGVGSILRHAWTHVEAVQTSDVPLVVQVIGEVLAFCAMNDDFAIKSFEHKLSSELLESVCFDYVSSLCLHLDSMGDDRVMPYVLERSIFSSATSLVARHGSSAVRPPTRVVMLKGLASICATEDFKARKYSYADDRDRETTAKLLDQDWLQELVEEDDDARKAIRPWLDFAKECKRGRK